VQGAIDPIRAPAGVGRENLTSALFVLGTEARPGSKSITVSKLGPIRTNFGQDGVTGKGVDGGDGGQIRAVNPIQFAAGSCAPLRLRFTSRTTIAIQDKRCRTSPVQPL